MSNAPVPPGSTLHASYDRSKLYLLSCIALTAAGMAFSIRGGIASTLKTTFFDPIDPAHSAERIGSVMGYAFLGFAISVLVGSPLCDTLGMGRLLAISCGLFLVGTLTTIFAGPLSGALSIEMVLILGMLSVGLAHGLVEAVINPLIATLYPDDKTHKLNILHSWWPGGLIIGGLISAIPDLGWQAKLAAILLPTILFGLLLLGTKFPPTERVAAAVPTDVMFREAFRPLFLIFLFCMLLTAATELAPGQWVDLALTRALGMPGILVLVYVSGLMFVMRYFAGPLAHRLSPVGLLWVSSLLAGIGLYFLSYANSPITGLLAATVWGIGVCYMWPTMLAVTSERFPKGGALLMGIMGSAGNLSIYFVLPALGKIFDNAKETLAKQGNYASFEALEKLANTDPTAQSKLNEILKIAAATSFRAVALLPIVLLIVFGAVWLYDRARGGYKKEVLIQNPTE